MEDLEVIMVELSAPWEEFMDEVQEQKRAKYQMLDRAVQERRMENPLWTDWGGMSRICRPVIMQIPNQAWDHRTG